MTITYRNIIPIVRQMLLSPAIMAVPWIRGYGLNGLRFYSVGRVGGYKRRLDEMDTKTLTVIASRQIQRQRINSNELLEGVAAELSRRDLKHVPPSLLVLTILASKKYDVRNSAYLSKVAELVADSIDRFPLHEIVQLIYNFGKLGITHEAFVERASDHIIKHDLFSQMNEHQISNVIYGFALYNNPPSRHMIFSNASKALTERIDLWDKFTPQAFSNILWSYEKAKFSSPKMLKQASNAILRRDLFNQEFELKGKVIAKVVKAFAALDVRDATLFNYVTAVIINNNLLNGRTFTPRCTTTLLVAYAQSEVYDKRLMEAASRFVRLTDFAKYAPRDIAIFLESAVKLGSDDDAMYKCAIEAAKRYEMHHYTSRNVASVLWALAKAEKIDAELFHKFADGLCGRLFAESSLGDVVRISWAFHKSGIRVESLSRDMLSYLMKFHLPTVTKKERSLLDEAMRCIDLKIYI
jgi:hypothetical protein